MIRPIVRDVLFLNRKCAEAGKEDINIGKDLMATLLHHRDHCIGLAANMIGERKRVIAVADGPGITVLFNPKILEKHGEYQAEEGCLSLSGVRPATRYETIKVEGRDLNWKKVRKTFTGITAQAVQHEMDHLEGILI